MIKLRDVEVGTTLCVMRDGTLKVDFDLPYSKTMVYAGLPGGARLIEKRVREYLKQRDWHYKNRHLVVVEVGRWSGVNRVKAAWSNDDRAFGLAEFTFEVSEDYWDCALD